jgi:alditol oxidase
MYRATMPTVTGPFMNWARNVRFRATALVSPASLAELQRLVASTPRLRPIGTAHSFSPVADTDGCLVSVAGLPAVVEIDSERSAVRVSAGLRYSDIAPRLHDRGLALANLASLPHISVGGAVATGTHGSGDGNGSLATAVSGLELVTCEGDLITVRRGDASFDGMVVALGACGVVTALTLQTVPAFTVRQYVYTGVPFDQAAGHFGEITAGGYSVSLFTDWREPRFTQAWRKVAGPAGAPAEPEADSQWFGGRLADRELHPIAGMAADSCSPQLGQPGPWHERLPHFRPEFTPSAGDELQSEYLVPREYAAQALAALAGVGPQLAPVTQVSEVRTVAADDLWLSPAYQRDCAAFHFTWVPDPAAVLPVVTTVEAVLRPFAARPHWGKVFAMSPDSVAARYPRMSDFRRLALDLDPAGKFGNQVLDPLLGRASSG